MGNPRTAATIRDHISFHNKTSPNDGGEVYHDAADVAMITSTLLNVGKALFQVTLASAVVLHVLNQRHLLPRPIGRVVSKILFWPTFPLTKNILLRRPWMTEIDDVVVLGAAPVGFMNIPEKLNDEFDVKAVINMCDEYRGPIKKYEQLGIKELWLPTVDHFEPSLDHLKNAVTFLEKYEALNKRVYVHCRAGHGRSAAVVFAWMLYKNPNANPQFLNQQLCNQRNVRKTLWKQPNIQLFHSWLLLQQKENGQSSSISRRKKTSSETSHNHQMNSWLDVEVDNGHSTSDADADDIYDNSSDDERDY